MRKIIALITMVLCGSMFVMNMGQTVYTKNLYALPTPTGTLTPVPGGYPQYSSGSGDPANAAAWSGYLASLNLNPQGTPFTPTPTGSPTYTPTNTPTPQIYQAQYQDGSVSWDPSVIGNNSAVVTVVGPFTKLGFECNLGANQASIFAATATPGINVQYSFDGVNFAASNLSTNNGSWSILNGGVYIFSNQSNAAGTEFNMPIKYFRFHSTAAVPTTTVTPIPFTYRLTQ